MIIPTKVGFAKAFIKWTCKRNEMYLPHIYFSFDSLQQGNSNKNLHDKINKKKSKQPKIT